MKKECEKEQKAQRPHHVDIPQRSQQGDVGKKNDPAHICRRKGEEQTLEPQTEKGRGFKESVRVYVMALEVQCTALRAATVPDSEEEG